MNDNKKYWLNEYGERYWINEELNITLYRPYHWVDSIYIIDETDSRRHIGSMKFSTLNDIIYSSVYNKYYIFSDFVKIDKNYYRRKKIANIID